MFNVVFKAESQKERKIAENVEYYLIKFWKAQASFINLSYSNSSNANTDLFVNFSASEDERLVVFVNSNLNGYQINIAENIIDIAKSENIDCLISIALSDQLINCLDVPAIDISFYDSLVMNDIFAKSVADSIYQKLVENRISELKNNTI